VVLLIAHAILAFTSLRRNFVTLDEFGHLPAGLSYWQQMTFSLYHQNPPLLKMLAALPVLLAEPVVDYGDSWARAADSGLQPNQFDFGTDFMRSNTGRYFDLFNLGRCVIVAVSLLGCLLVFSWGRDLWGPGGGLLGASIWALDPNLLAHAGLVTTDMGATVAMFGAMYAFRRWLRSPTWGRATVAGGVLGLAQICKFSCLILYPLFAALAVIRWSARPRAGHGHTGPDEADRQADGWGLRRAVQCAAMLGLSLFVINLGYGFEGSGRPLGSFPLLSLGLTVPRTGGEPPYHPNATYQRLYRERQNRFENTLLARLPTPLPAHYVLGFDAQLFEANIGLPGAGYPVYLRGQVRREGWPTYYLYALALKVPLGTWLLAASGLIAALLFPALRARVIDEAAWALPAATVFGMMSLLTGMDLGVRYVLPLFPFLFVGVGRLARLTEGSSRRALAATAILCVGVSWNAVETLITWPHYLSYFNEAAGGPSGGHRYLVDSNLDWGQDLLELRHWLESHPQPQPIALAYFGNVDPGIAGISYRLPPRDPRIVPPARRLPDEESGLRPGTYAVSVNLVEGLPYHLRSENGDAVSAYQGAFAYFNTLRPAARAGYSIWIFQLGERDVAQIRHLWMNRSQVVL